MAARNPSDFNRWIDQRKLLPRDKIYADELDKVIDDQHYVLDAGRLVLSTIFYRYETQSGTFVNFRNIPVISKNMCGVSGVSNDEISHEVSALCWGSLAGSDGEVKVSSNATASASATLAAAGGTTPTWTPFGTLNIKTNGIEDTLVLEARSTGTGNFYVGGLLVVALET